MPDTASAWPFHCGVCTKVLKDANALFTSCGHFFCADTASCTRLKPGRAAGRCEQCTHHCDAGLLENMGARYDDKLRSFVFKNVQTDLKTIAEIVEFRDKHLSILGENAASQASRIRNLKAEYASQTQDTDKLRVENDSLRAESASLRTENDSLRAQVARFMRTSKGGPIDRPSQPQLQLPRVPSVEIVDESSTRMEPVREESPPRETMRYGQSRAEQGRAQNSARDLLRYGQSRAEQGRAQNSAMDSLRYGQSRADPTRGQNPARDKLRYEQPRSKPKPPRPSPARLWGARTKAAGSSADPRGVRNSKRRWEARPEPSVATFNRSRRMEPPLAKRSRRVDPPVDTGSRAQRSAPRFSSRETGITGLSQFARGAGPNCARGSEIRGSTKRQPGDWQRRVSTVPRPSATPDRLGRNPPKRSRHGVNPMARW